jgi:hypothetical protein
MAPTLRRRVALTGCAAAIVAGVDVEEVALVLVAESDTSCRLRRRKRAGVGSAFEVVDTGPVRR